MSLLARAGSLPESARRAACAWYVDGAIGSTLQIGLILSPSKDDPVGIAVLGDERLHRLKGRSSSAIAKYALAFRRISLRGPSVRWPDCNARFSHFSALIRSRSSVLGPSRVPFRLPDPVPERLAQATDLGRREYACFEIIDLPNLILLLTPSLKDQYSTIDLLYLPTLTRHAMRTHTKNRKFEVLPIYKLTYLTGRASLDLQASDRRSTN